ncbi:MULTISPECIES: hypothetical protein [Streptomyces]|uniref:Uncharacterized protein n=1 Tax=Streptomyces cremeus TaxID=66881 RepID=A0ABV5PMY1_STRCM
MKRFLLTVATAALIALPAVSHPVWQGHDRSTSAGPSEARDLPRPSSCGGRCADPNDDTSWG